MASTDNSNILRNGEIWLHGTVGKDVVEGMEGFTARDVGDALARVGSKPVTVRVNSGGGWASEGVATYNVLDGHKGKVTVVVEGVAASAASVLAMAGDEIIMRPGAFMMVHEAASVSVGTADDHSKAVEALRKINQSMADIYAATTQRPIEAVQAEMAAETWMTADEAVNLGYADDVRGAGAASKAVAFDWSMYTKTPANFAASAGRATASAQFRALCSMAGKVRSGAHEEVHEDAISAFLKDLVFGRSDPNAVRAGAAMQRNFPDIYAKAHAEWRNGPRTSASIAASWDRVIERVNRRMGLGS